MAPILTHLALHVTDLERSIEFYAKYCEMRVIHRRSDSDGGGVVWMSERGRETKMVFVLISGGPRRPKLQSDFSHAGFALESRDAVDRIAERGREAGCLVWPPREDEYPVGYFCGLSDPDGLVVEFSFGQPLGPGAPQGDAVASSD